MWNKKTGGPTWGTEKTAQGTEEQATGEAGGGRVSRTERRTETGGGRVLPSKHFILKCRKDVTEQKLKLFSLRSETPFKMLCLAFQQDP